MARCYQGLGMIAQDRGDFDEAARQYQRTLDISERLGDRAGIASSYHNLGILARGRGDYDEAACVPGESSAATANVLLPDAQDKRGGVTVDEHRVCAFRAFRRVVCSRCRRVAHGGGARGAGIAWMSLACAAGPGEGMGMPGTGPGG